MLFSFVSYGKDVEKDISVSCVFLEQQMESMEFGSNPTSYQPHANGKDVSVTLLSTHFLNYEMGTIIFPFRINVKMYLVSICKKA
jgi:hypothetical protein